jgi:hypothetical protein
MKFPSNALAGEGPFDRIAVALKAAVPNPDFVLQASQIDNSTSPQALATEQTDLNLGTVGTTAMLGRAIDSGAYPN